MKFAKLFGPDDDQVLVTLGEGETGPEVRIHFHPPGLGVCSVATEFEDSERGFDLAQRAFELFDEAEATRIARKTMDELIAMAESA